MEKCVERSVSVTYFLKIFLLFFRNLNLVIFMSSMDPLQLGCIGWNGSTLEFTF